MRFLAVLLAMTALTPANAAAPQGQLPPQMVAAVKSLHPQQGRIAIDQASATLDLGTAYDFYGRDDARKILVDIWGNPPEAATNVLGIVMPASASPISDGWGAVVTYEDSGFVSDDDAADVDYNELLGQMREGEADRNAERKRQGYTGIHLAGWAEQPKYDPATHSVIWAQDLTFDDTQAHTLNYDVRTLGRKGVLSINFVSSMAQLPSIRQAAHAFTAHAAFDPGARYADYDASTDKKADYGVAGLIAAGVGVAAAKKLGFLAILLKFLKPILLAVVAGFAFLRKRVMALFGRKESEPAEWEHSVPVEPEGVGERGNLRGEPD
ncbi:hypothetical protein GCM10011614_10950 [Novosphingobium colocasiae]|uniref:DUF2167 domain-containing protein n=2 Tax=Novosphingobium colocasiae TaxID=1256513 RepID=A0A918PC84_9SPHN|nr:hypothetical protein GCM10011614_10950 [Novosphingobium colocasiae]